MYTDYNTFFSRAQSFGGAGPLGAALTVSTNVIDLQVARDVAEGSNNYVRFLVTTAFTAGGSAPRICMGLGYADDAAMTVNLAVPVAATGGAPLLLGGTDTIGSFGGYVAAGLTLGQEILLPIPPQQYGQQRYMGIIYVQPAWATAYFGVGAFDASIVHDPYRHTLYNDAVN